MLNEHAFLRFPADSLGGGIISYQLGMLSLYLLQFKVKLIVLIVRYLRLIIVILSVAMRVHYAHQFIVFRLNVIDIRIL